ncbi:helix-turn-helix transcriptional regulator [Murinocardiopsis flavida]|uniref:helix-turn-helix transcriptional regulator n=1 Tax=Murinocardiopsis flavida TaxID=645275 RepID=UPI0011B27045|nr:LuxR family transcriptional regulator [Murinocardiopsis flavida]
MTSDDSINGRLQRLIADAEENRGSFAIITGPNGFGKTRILHGLANHASQSDIGYLGAACRSSERFLSLGIANQIFSPLNIEPSDLSRRLKLLDHFSLNAEDYLVPTAYNQGADLAQGLWETLAEQAEDKVLLITVDDVHFADSLSLEILLHFINRIHTSRILFVLTAREDAGGVPANIRSRLMYHPNCRRIQLAPIAAEETSALIRNQIDTDFSEEQLAESHRISGGNPLLVQALVEDHHNIRRGIAGLAPGEAFAGSVQLILDRIPSISRAVAQAASVLGDHTEIPLLATMLELKEAEVGRQVEWLERIGLLIGARFRCRATEAAVKDEIDSSVLEQLHQRAADLLHAFGMSSSAVARHLLDGRAPYEEWAFGVLREAAEHALATWDLESAVQYLRLAVQIRPDSEHRLSLILALAKAEWQLNPAMAAGHLTELAEAAHKGRLQNADIYWVLTCALWGGKFDDAATLYDLLRDDRPGFEDDESANWHVAATSWIACTYPSLFAGRVGCADIEKAQERHSPLSLRTRVITDYARMTLGDGGDATLKSAGRYRTDAEFGIDSITPIEAALFSEIHSDRLYSSIRSLDSLFSSTKVRSSPLWRSVHHAYKAFIELRLGDLINAAENARKSLEVLPLRSLGVFAALGTACAIEAYTELGEYDLAEQYVKRPVPEISLDTRYGIYYLGARARYYSATGFTHSANRDLLRCGKKLQEWGMDNPSFMPWRLELAQLSAKATEFGRSRRLIRQHNSLPHEDSPRVRAMGLVALATTQEPRRRPALLREAVDLLQETDYRLQLAHTLTELSCTLAGLGEMSKARLVGQQAASLAASCDAAPLQGEVSMAVEGHLDSQPDDGSQDALSPAEYRVASLAALGYTNREISKKIYITVSTVEQHLTRIYRKLDVDGRNDLPLVMKGSAAAH